MKNYSLFVFLAASLLAINVSRSPAHPFVFNGGEMFSCQYCGTAIHLENRIASIGDLETFRCPSCDKEVLMTVSRAFSELRERDETMVRAVLRWHGSELSAKELSGLRRVVPDFRNVGLSEVKQAVKGKHSWELGVFTRPYALAELTTLVSENGLTLELQEIDSKS
jgi:hypothetical protein